MLQRLINQWKGEVVLRVESGFPERVLNVCAARQIPFWDLRWESPLAFTFTMTRRDFARLRGAAERLDCAIRVERRAGVPFFLRRFRRRYALVAGLGLGLLACFFGSFFIWDIEIEGNVTVREEEILRALERNGVSIGTFGYDIQSEQLRNRILLELPELIYIAVNVHGCRAHVQVRERLVGPASVDKRQPGNTVASRDALVTDIRPYDGKKLVLPGTMVQKGQLLISGVTDDEQAGTRFLRGMGEVYGRTWYTLDCKTTDTALEKRYTGEEHTRFALCWGERRVNLYLGGSPDLTGCDKTVTRTPLELPGGFPLPITVVRETYRVYEIAETPRAADSAKAAGRLMLEEYLLSGLEGEVKGSIVTAEELDGVWQTRLQAECEEQIGVFVEIPLQSGEG